MKDHTLFHSSNNQPSGPQCFCSCSAWFWNPPTPTPCYWGRFFWFQERHKVSLLKWKRENLLKRQIRKLSELKGSNWALGTRNWKAVEIQVVFSVSHFSFLLISAHFILCSLWTDFLCSLFSWWKTWPPSSSQVYKQYSLSFWVPIPNSKEGTLLGLFCVSGPWLKKLAVSRGQDQATDI